MLKPNATGANAPSDPSKVAALPSAAAIISEIKGT
eukprot:CAMPEP_0172631700 /NCGR_PEP_ID=MMETSP1068-20121228/180671_1 /TAXON_ID=35684 /ORGANISM="Pseudopedinella elastica, Strain CCMP716" /LENGTH=34 /DNA_ID= /DNA_START= /DNA_END= /DNA_ORIENTATION=